MLQSALREIDMAIRNNPLCSGGLLAHCAALGMEQGPSGDREIIALLCADPVHHFWYGHVMKHPRKPGFAALLAWSDILVNAETPDLLFRRYHYVMFVLNDYHPPACECQSDVYAESPSFRDAVANLLTMIRRFDPEKQCGAEDGPYSDLLTSMASFDFYGLDMRNREDKPSMPRPYPALKIIRKNQEQESIPCWK